VAKGDQSGADVEAGNGKTSHVPVSLSRQLAYASLTWGAAVIIFLFGSIFADAAILDPTHNPKIGVYAYWFMAPAILVTLITVLVMVVRMWTIWGYWTDPRLNPGRRPPPAGAATPRRYASRTAPYRPNTSTAPPSPQRELHQ
jgi:hypothetical protein